MAIDIGKKRHRVTVQQHSSTVASNGQKTRVWSVYCRRWASVKAVSGGETWRNRQLQADSTHVLDLHSDSETREITTQMRVLVGRKMLNIVRAYDQEGDNAEVWLEAKEDT